MSEHSDTTDEAEWEDIDEESEQDEDDDDVVGHSVHHHDHDHGAMDDDDDDINSEGHATDQPAADVPAPAAAVEQKAEGPGCPHYRRGCLLKAPCCGAFYVCRFCHDEDSKKACTEEMAALRHLVTQVKCSACGLEQPVQGTCSGCGLVFGEYFCATCRLYDSLKKQIFHCDGCGICRVGGRENFKHCDRCIVCYATETFAKHKCIDKAAHTNCPVCLEFLHTSTKPLYVPDCGHILHRECYLHLASSRPTCPTCLRSFYDITRFMDEEIARCPMPTDYADTYVRVLCNDCLAKSIVKFHVVGHKCAKCSVYNTTVIAGPAPRTSLPEN